MTQNTLIRSFRDSYQKYKNKGKAAIHKFQILSGMEKKDLTLYTV